MINIAEAAGRLIKVATGEEYGDGEVVTALAIGYAEPGYGTDETVVVLGNWNPPPGPDRKWDGKSIPERLAAALERIGAEIQWSDEWTECQECYRVVRSQANSYHWKPSYHWVEDVGPVCSECQVKYGEDALTEYVNDPTKAVTWCEADHLEQYGYTKWEAGDEHTYENGWHAGQTDDPKVILPLILEGHDDREVIFFLDESSQFYIRFSAYVREPNTEEDDAE